MRVRAMAMVLALAGVASTSCVVTVQSGAERGDARLRNQGWRKLGERMVNGGGVDKDRIVVGRGDGTFRRLMIVVEHSSLELYDMNIEFTNGQHYSPNLRHRFREGSRSHQIDLPGDKRTIRDVTFKYANLPGGGAAQIELWGRN